MRNLCVQKRIDLSEQAARRTNSSSLRRTDIKILSFRFASKKSNLDTNYIQFLVKNNVRDPGRCDYPVCAFDSKCAAQR